MKKGIFVSDEANATVWRTSAGEFSSSGLDPALCTDPGRTIAVFDFFSGPVSYLFHYSVQV
jgi:hypothetical protein